jgi:hypothetical protein
MTWLPLPRADPDGSTLAVLLELYAARRQGRRADPEVVTAAYELCTLAGAAAADPDRVFLKARTDQALLDCLKRLNASITTRRMAHPEDFKADMATLFDLLRDRAIHPVVIDRLPLAATRGPRSHRSRRPRPCYYPGPRRDVRTIAFERLSRLVVPRSGIGTSASNYQKLRFMYRPN